jgi:hypothetical protein
MKRWPVGVIILLMLPAIGMTQTAAIKRIDAYARSVDAFVRKHPAANIVIADVSEYDTEKPQWRRFASEADLSKFRENSETYTVAYNYRKGRKIVASDFTKFSPSGDWAKYLFHYFRGDGSVAKVSSELRTFYGDFIVIQDLYFDRKGKQLKKTVRYLDLTTRKPKKPTKDDLDAFAFSLDEKDYYEHSSMLPFAAILSR